MKNDLTGNDYLVENKVCSVCETSDWRCIMVYENYRIQGEYINYQYEFKCKKCGAGLSLDAEEDWIS